MMVYSCTVCNGNGLESGPPRMIKASWTRNDYKNAIGSWVNSTTARQDIKRAIHSGMEWLIMESMSCVSVNEICLAIAHESMELISASQEIVDCLKFSPVSFNTLEIREPLKTFYGLTVQYDDRRTNPTLVWPNSERPLYEVEFVDAMETTP